MAVPLPKRSRPATPSAQLFERVLGMERDGATRTGAFDRLAEELGASRSAVQSRFYDEARRRGGVPERARPPARPGKLAASGLRPVSGAAGRQAGDA